MLSLVVLLVIMIYVVGTWLMIDAKDERLANWRDGVPQGCVVVPPAVGLLRFGYVCCYYPRC